MPYVVELTERAQRDLEYLYVLKNAEESKAAADWYNRLEVAVQSLAVSPKRSPLAPEGRLHNRELRHLLYGRKPHVYRIIYELEARRKRVLVLTIRHGAQETRTGIQPTPR